VLDLSLHGVSLRLLDEVSLTFPRSTHTAIVGPPASGASTLLRILAGEERPSRGMVHIGSRDVTKLSASRRPLLFATASLDFPMRWSVEHALINAVRSRTLDRVDRHLELQLAASKWHLDALLGRSIATLSDHERTRVQLARIELRKPAVVIADRLLHDAPDLADEWYRTLRVIGATAISATAATSELGYTDRIVVLDRGRVVQEGAAAHVYSSPNSEASAIATGAVNVIPIVISRGVVESPIGSWSSHAFEGEGIALARPRDFEVATKGEDSDLIFGIEEASFQEGRWLARGFITGVLTLQVELPREVAVEKGRLLPLRYDPSRFTLLPTR
jgi:ABC-type sugar transport system ATPase subunit